MCICVAAGGLGGVLCVQGWVDLQNASSGRVRVTIKCYEALAGANHHIETANNLEEVSGTNEGGPCWEYSRVGPMRLRETGIFPTVRERLKYNTNTIRTNTNPKDEAVAERSPTLFIEADLF